MITKDDILRNTNGGLDIFRHYIPGNWKPGKSFHAPFYRDRNASATVWYCKQNTAYMYKDFGDGTYDGDCFAFVGRLNGWDCRQKDDFVRIMEKIVNDLGIRDYSYTPSTVTATRSYTPQQVADTLNGETLKNKIIPMPAKDFSTLEISWWNTFGITYGTLNRYNVTCLKGITFTEKATERKSTDAEPMYLYTYGPEETSQKVYCPHSQHRFLFIRKAETDYFGFTQLPEKGETVILTGGEKDVLTLAAAGFNALCMNSETAALPEYLVKELSERFTRIIILYDTDKTGREASRRIRNQYEDKYNLLEIILPLNGEKKEKDVSDYYRKLNDRNLFISEVNRLASEASTLRYQRLAERFSPYVIDYKNPPVQPPATISINEQTAATPGDLVCITGGAGTGKSNYAAGLFSGALNTTCKEIDTLGAEIAPNKEKKALLYFDTEQSEYQSYLNLKRLTDRVQANHPPEEMMMASLCKIERKKRMEVIQTCMRACNERWNGIHLVVIDGLADLVSSANEEAESIQLIEQLQMLAQSYRTVIAGVVHTAGIQDKVRGHLGSEFTRKASAVISIEKDKKEGRSAVKVLKLRAGSAERTDITFLSWDERAGYFVSSNK